MEKLNWGIIGLGEIARKFSEGFLETQNSKLIAVASKNVEKLNFFKNKFNIDNQFLFNAYEDILNCKEVDVIYIALPNSLHYDWIIKSVQNKKNVLVEKPATVNFNQAYDIKQILTGHDLFFGEAFMYRHFPQLDYVLKLIKNNEIGNLVSMESFFGVNLLTKKKFFLFKKKKKINKENRLFNKNLGGGCILDLGCYPSSLSLLISSLIEKNNFKNFKIQNFHKEIGETGVEVDASVEIFFENQFKSKIRSSFKKNLGKETVIHGTHGKIIINNTWTSNESIQIVNSRKKQTEKFDCNKNIYSYQIEQISKNILQGIKKTVFPAVSIDETLMNMRLIEDWKNA